jgi:hypothetical protein
VRAEAVRCVAICLALAGCLSAPPDARSVDAGAGGAFDGSPLERDDGGAPGNGCAEGSELDLAYLNRVGVVGNGAGSQIALADFAVVVNPGLDLVETDDLAVSIRTGDGIGATIELDAREGGLTLPPGQAHGAVAVDYAARVLSDVDETWSDFAFPALAIDLSITDPLDGETGVLVELIVDGYRFEAPITLVPGAHFEADGLGADRILAGGGR